MSSVVTAKTRGAKSIFISHSSADDEFVRELRAALTNHGQNGWVDSRELGGGDPMWSTVRSAIDNATAYLVVVSTQSLQSRWVGKELRHALKVRKKRGQSNFPIVPLSLDGTRLGVLEEFFGEEPNYVAVTSAAGGVEAAIGPILVALGERLPTEVPTTPQPKAEPLEELVLQLTDLTFHEEDGARRASARARLVYEPAMSGQPEVTSAQTWRLVAPIGPIEADELRWYLEKYPVWPSYHFRDRARKVEEDLVKWGRALYETAMPVAYAMNVMDAWGKISGQAGRRFSVYVDATVEAGAPVPDDKIAKEAATFLLGLPWELLHDGDAYLFQGAKPIRVRRRLPNIKVLQAPVVNTPIRILLVTPRPEDDSCGYMDHRTSARPLVETMESMPGLVEIHVLSPPTFAAFSKEVDRAFHENKPYHVVHFDGHGVYNRNLGLGALCFEEPKDTNKLEKRQHVTVSTSELGPLLRDYRIPLVFLDACQTAQAEKASESVASELLKVGVASVVAMSHSVLIETARRFVEAFYQALADGKRVGDAMLEGQRLLKDDAFRGSTFGAGELRLEDWFVPVLFQEKGDPQLFETVPAKQTREDFLSALAARLGDLPSAPETGFVGRSRELLTLERLLCPEGSARYAVVRGQGGEGKTALAAEFARWMVRSQQLRRAAFVCVEGLERNIAESVLDRLGSQLVKPGFSAQADCGGDLGRAEQEIERVLREQPTLLIVDNMESVLRSPLLGEIPEALAEEMREELEDILALCDRLLTMGDTRLVFTSRETLPEPFDAEHQCLELRQLGREDAVKLVERVLSTGGGEAGTLTDAAREEIDRLVEAVHCHARTLTLLAPALRNRGVEGTRESLVDLMAEMERRFPGSREHSVFASVELSLQRLSRACRERARVLGVFHGAADMNALRVMMEWEDVDVAALAVELIGVGLATPDRYDHVTFNPALCPYLRAVLDGAELEALTARWVGAMTAYLEFLKVLRWQDVEMSTTLTQLELPNLFALLDLVWYAGDVEETTEVTTSLHSVLQNSGKPRLLERLGQVRDAVATASGDAWTSARFDTLRTRIEQQLTDGRLGEALEGAQNLLERARAAGDQAYLGAEYDLAMACNLLGQALEAGGRAEQALSWLDEARGRFEVIAKGRSRTDAETMVAVCIGRRGDCLLDLGRLDESAAAYSDCIRRRQQLGDNRGVARTQAALAQIWTRQRRYPEALTALTEARKKFTELGEPSSVASCWHQIGMVYQQGGQPEPAEDAYRKSLAISTALGHAGNQAATLTQLGVLYDDVLNRPGEAVALFGQAVAKYLDTGDVANEGRARSNLAFALRELHRSDEARNEFVRAIACKELCGSAAEPWTSWAALADIEGDAGNAAAATEAKRKAIDWYLAYRRAGGEGQTGPRYLAFVTTENLQTGGPTAAASFLEQIAASPDAGPLTAFIDVLKAIVAGSRDRALAEARGLDIFMAAETLLLIDSLDEPGSRSID